MKRIKLFLILLAFILLVGCGGRKTVETDTFLTEWESVTDEMVRKIDRGDVDGAKTLFVSRKEDLRSKWELIQRDYGSLDSESMKKMEALGTKNMFAVAGAGSRMRLSGNKAEMGKLKALAIEYGDTFNIHFDSILFEIPQGN